MSRTLSRVLVGATALVGLVAFPAPAAKDDLDLVSVATGGAAAADDSRQPSISADGTRIAFVSSADNLSAEDVDGVANVFVRDLATGTTTLVSRANGPLGAGGDGDSLWPSISADGRHVAFQSDADNLSTGDDDTVGDVFVRDLATATTTLVSRPPGAFGVPADAASSRPAISADGGHVAFLSDADNLVDGENPLVANVVVRDLAAGTVVLASRASGPGGVGADASSGAPAISADGRRVAFESEATNLSAEDLDAVEDVFIRDLGRNLTLLVSRAAGAAGAAGDADSADPSISGDGRRVAFVSRADNLSAEDDDSVQDVFVRDLPTATTVLVIRRTGAGPPADGPGEDPAISADGSRVAFQADADNLGDEDDDRYDDVYLRDLGAATTTLVSRAAGAVGAAADGSSSAPALSADGRYVTFRSLADNLSALDLDPVSNIFRRDVLGAPPAPPAPVVRCAGFRATIVGTPGRDVIRGTARRDVIHARGGDDLVRGLGGDDVICLGAGHDRGVGGRGFDRILGGAGRDVMLGGFGPDVLQGGPGRDRAIGGRGADLCQAERRATC